MPKMQLYFTALAILFSSVLFAQESLRNCGTMEADKRLKESDPAYIINRQQIEEFTQAWIADPANAAGSRAVVTIPVVFHVVYNNASENISDAQLMSQLTVLTNDFRRLNADAINTPAYFAGIAADAEIQFCLATTDPNGNPTTGITRTSTTKTSFGTDDKVKYTSQGGEDAWNRDKYLNIWVCDLSGGVLGYAQFPGGPAATDGVVIDYQYTGSGGTALSPYDLGRSATHEVGHWLNLYHIWGDDGTSCGGSDSVADTPNQADETYGCPSGTRISCSNGPNGDMYENYMDYTDDACMNLYTAGQKSRMQALFAVGGSRYALLSSTGCSGGGGGGCSTPTGLSASSVTSSSATVSWGSVTGATSYNIQYKPSASGTWTTTTSATTSKSLTGLTSGTAYDYKVQTVCSGGSTSSYSSVANFTTTGGGGTCVDIQEPNSTSGTAGTINAGTTYQALIATSTDADWYKFTTSGSQTKIKVTMSSLPFDYDIRLYNQSVTQKGISENSGTADETIIWNTTTSGTRYLKVYGWAGAFSSSDCYDLLVQTSSSNWRTEPGATVFEDGYDNMIQSIYPNPVADILNINYLSVQDISVDVKLFDLLGKQVKSTLQPVYNGENTFTMDVNDLAPGFYVIQISNGKSVYAEKFIIQ